MGQKWRLQLSIVKTEFCMFSSSNKVLEEARDHTFVIDGQIIKLTLTTTQHQNTRNYIR